MDAPPAVRTRLRVLLAYYEALGFAEFESFLSESTDDDGLRHFESLWLFNHDATMEAHLSENEDDQLDGARVRGRLVRWAIRSKDYDFRRAGPDSRMSVQLWYTNDIWGDINATGANCDRLRELLRRYVLTETGVSEEEHASA
jgi:hypothetical protein